MASNPLPSVSLRQLEKMPSTSHGSPFWLMVNVGDASENAVWVQTRIWLMLGIFLISLFASCFPSLSQRLPGVRVPPIVFFIGKHFGTGIIISTAFGHLLQDAYEALLNPIVKERWAVSKWVGMIILSSLLLIFFVEYISTSFVDRLQSYPSEPSSPCDTPLSGSPTPSRPVSLSRDSSRRPSLRGSQVVDAPLPLAPPESSADVNAPASGASAGEGAALNRTAPAGYGAAGSGQRGRRPAAHAHTFPRSVRRAAGGSESVAASSQVIFAGGHHRHEARESHAEHHRRSRDWSGWFGLDGRERSGDEEDDAAGRAVLRRKSKEPNGHANGSEGARGVNRHAHHSGHVHSHGHVHMGMESWSPEDGEVEQEVDGAADRVGMRRQVIGILMLGIGIMLHSLVIGLTLAITSGGEFTSLVTAIVFHQLFEGLSLGIRIATLPAAAARDVTGSPLLKPILALSFAITTPIGIGIGLAAFEPGRSEGAKLTLIRGLMSALSAGMLIYAACVEMLAGDFVLDPHLWRSGVARQVLALGSLLLGCVAMGVVGILGE